MASMQNCTHKKIQPNDVDWIFTNLCTNEESFLKPQSLCGTCNFRTVIYTIFWIFYFGIANDHAKYEIVFAWYLKLTAQGWMLTGCILKIPVSTLHYSKNFQQVDCSITFIHLLLGKEYLG